MAKKGWWEAGWLAVRNNQAVLRGEGLRRIRGRGSGPHNDGSAVSALTDYHRGQNATKH